MSEIKTPPLSRFSWANFFFYSVCLLMIVTGLVMRFSWMNWHEESNLHPDEYGLTNTLTQLSMPTSLEEYFNTRLSPISPYNKYDEAGQLMGNGTDNRMRWGQWPIILIRWAGELTDNTGYDEIRVMGRHLSALADTLSLLLIFLIGRRLFGSKVGILAAALSSLAVMQIQQSHFMTVDNFATLFCTTAIYACVRIAQIPCVKRLEGKAGAPGSLKIEPGIWKWVVLFGVSFGMAVATKINLVPLSGMILIAVFISIADIKLKSQEDILHILKFAVLLVFAAALISVITFRVTQPMSFRAETGDTTFFTIHLNQDWMDSMEVASNESRGIGGGPPSEQWAHRTRVLYPLMNMVFWGMGLPLGVACWSGLLAAIFQLVKKRADWRAHLIPLVWAGGYFLFMSTRWVSSLRYFLPIYPFLCLFAAWGLLQFWNWAIKKTGGKRRMLPLLASIVFVIVISGTWIWSFAFTRAVYVNRHTRNLASEWIIANIPGAINLTMQSDDGDVNVPVAAPNDLMIEPDIPYVLTFTAPANGSLVDVFMPRVSTAAAGSQIRITIASDAGGENIIGEATLSSSDPDALGEQGQFELSGDLAAVQVRENVKYYLWIYNLGSQPVTLSKLVLSNENWDEGLPVRIGGWDPFGQLYNGITMEVRWYDDEAKRQMFIESLSETDYIILPSQRAIWSVCRIPRTYPMTMEYYRALFNGELGFELVAEFNTPMQIGPLYISDVGGTFSWDTPPELPLFNLNPLAAEEAFSVYDHPPVWIFKKSADFDIEDVEAVLNNVDLSTVVIESPREASAP